jgi:RNA polymerase sigma-54 factor
MKMSFGMEARQIQSQKLAPRMIQSMEILQLPMLALQERIEREMSENPLLELMEEEGPAADDERQDEENPDAPTESERELVVDSEHDNLADFERLLEMDNVLPNTFDDSFRPSSNRMQADADRQHDLMSNAESRAESLNDFLLHQLAELDIDDEVERLAERIISALDARDGGYLRVPLPDLLPAEHTAEQLGLAEEALRVVQSLDPPGIASRNLQECLLKQLRDGMPFVEDMRILISHHLEDLADNRLPLIHRRTGMSIDRIQVVREELHNLNPKPGAEFLKTKVPTVTPDVSVEQAEDGTFKVLLDEDRVPRLYISEYYRKRLMDPTAKEEEKEYIRKKLINAQWLIESIEQRRMTLTRVTQAIVDHQQRFFQEGPEGLEPLKMQQIAERVGVHVTTVSRAVDDKWVQTPRGLFPLKRFFVGGTQTDDGEDIAWDTIRLKLQEVVDKEDKSHPMSDDDLVVELNRQGFNVARRTVTKYRKRMGILSSRHRRDWSR